VDSCPSILVSAGEASGDRYAARVVDHLRLRYPDAQFFGCAGPEMRDSGVTPVVETESLSVVGIAEVLAHIPRIYGEYRRLLAQAERRRPRFALLTDSPDFHLRVARRLHGMGIPVFYLVAPQAWAWREGRTRQLRRNVRQLHCIFPFEEDFFRRRGVAAHYIGHPLARLVQASGTKQELRQALGVPPGRPLVTLCPGSRRGEIDRHWPVLREAVLTLARNHTLDFIWAVPRETVARFGQAYFDQRTTGLPVRLVEGHTWDALAAADVALPASGTVATEAAMLGIPMVTYYRVSRSTWLLGRHLVRAPFFTMVNLVAGRRIVAELIQQNMTAANLAREVEFLLGDATARRRQQDDLAEVAARLRTPHDPLELSAALIAGEMERVK
jgi:lipid-A-disaccharide synthase